MANGKNDAVQSGGEQETQWLTREQQKAWRTFLYTTTRLREQLSQTLEQDPEIDLSLAEYEILVRLSESDDHRVRMSELAEHVVHSRSRLTHTIARMENRGLVMRERCALDGRGREALLTPKGFELLQKAAPLHVQSVRECFIDGVGNARFLKLGAILSVLLNDDDRASIEHVGK